MIPTSVWDMFWISASVSIWLYHCGGTYYVFQGLPGLVSGAVDIILIADFELQNNTSKMFVVIKCLNKQRIPSASSIVGGWTWGHCKIWGHW